jgi:uncharacterized membrane protein
MKLKDLFKQYFVAGVLLLAPLVVSIWLVISLINWVDSVFGTENWASFEVPGFGAPLVIPGLGLILAFVIILLAGAVGKNVMGSWLMTVVTEVFQKVPVVGSVYSGIRQTLSALFSNQERQFGGAVLVQWPRPGVWVIGLVTSNHSPSEFDRAAGQDLVAVFIPTTPVPTAGFLSYYPRSEVKPLDMKVETALRMIVSLGIAEGERSKPNGH